MTPRLGLETGGLDGGVADTNIIAPVFFLKVKSLIVKVIVDIFVHFGQLLYFVDAQS